LDRSMPSLPFPSRARQDAHAGFVLPLASAAALVLLLSSLSLQTLALQSRSRVRAQWLQRQQGDALASAAQQLAVQLQGPGQCLLRGPSQPCGAGPDPAGLLPNASPAQVSQWLLAAPGSAQVRLRLRDSPAARSFAVAFDPSSGRVLQLRSLGQ
uniref:hypothetical protein n=1 Tax=Cyanobium sp. TaxID=2164130 RepID=UPI00404B26F3